jgi:hypothetical protein
MTPRSGMTAPSPGALRMRRSRERRRQGDVMVTLKVGPNMTANLANLDWLPAPDRVDKDTIARALAGLIDHAITMRVTPSAGIEGVRVAPLRVTPEPIAVGLDESAGRSPKLRKPFELGGRHVLELGRAQPGQVFREADAVEHTVDDKPREVKPFGGTDTAPHGSSSADVPEDTKLSQFEQPGAQPSAEPIWPFEVESAGLWGQRLPLYKRWKIWAPEWGPRPDQEGCLAPDYLL